MTRLYILLFVGSLIAAAGTGAYVYVNNLQSKIEALQYNAAVAEANKKALKNAVEQQQAVIDRIEEDNKLKEEIINKIMLDFNQSRNIVRDLQDNFDSSNLAQSALSDPKLVQDVINIQSQQIMRCIELASGVGPTVSELEATTANTINPICPSLANPNYKGPK